MLPIITAIQHSYQTYIEHHPNFANKIYIACSGGRDSMALLFACQQLQLPIHVIHINHQLQMVSDGWQQLVESYCQKHNISFDSVRIDWQSQHVFDANVYTINEQQARTARYQAIIDIAGENAIIALAHHANDQAETLLMNLCQGTGLAGLTGMAELAQQTEFGKPIWLWRPLLTVMRDEISQFIDAHCIPYVDDPTNFATDNQRAFLRNQIMPLLNTRFNKVVQNITRTQKNLAEANDIIDEQYQHDLALCQLANGWTAYQRRMDIKQLKSLSHARRFNLLHTWTKGSQKFAPNRQLIEQIEQLILSAQQDQQAILQWQGIEIRKYRNILYRLEPNYATVIHAKSSNLVTLALAPNFGLLLKTRDVLPNEQFRLKSQPFHQSFKKICQRYEIPSWERQFAKVVALDEENVGNISQNQSQSEIRLALLLPSTSYWLDEAIDFDLLTNTPCTWHISLKI